MCIDIENFKPDLSKRPVDKFIITPGASRVYQEKGFGFFDQGGGSTVAEISTNLFESDGGWGPPQQPLSDAEYFKYLGVKTRIEKVMNPILENLPK